MMDKSRVQSKGERSGLAGQVLITVAFGMVVLVGFLALSVDVGFALAEREQVQSAADAAAVAAAEAARNSAPSAQVINTAKSYGATNAEVTEDDVVVELPPTSGEYSGDSNFIRVSITKDVQRFFLEAIFQGDWQVSATATAGIVPEGFDAAMLALNPDSGGIKTRGNSTIVVNGGSVVSNFDINTGGSTTITADQWVVANDGFNTSGNTNINGGVGENQSGPEIPDPLADLIDPPVLPVVPANPVPNVSPASQACYSKPGYYPPPVAADYIGAPGTYSGGGSGCITITGDGNSSKPYVFPAGQYRFTGGAGMSFSYQHAPVRLQGGTYNFVGQGITIGGNSNTVELRAGNYSFLNGARINIGGSSPQNILGGGGTTATDSYFYFSGSGGITTGGNNRVILNPGTYIFNGGPGLNMSGSDRLEFNPGTYKFWFTQGADLSMSGSSNFNVPSGAFYFERGRFLNSGNSQIVGEEVFLYFKNGGYLQSTGSAGFGFTAPETEIYPGYYPSVFMYSDASNTATFTWNGASVMESVGTVYLPSSRLVRTGASFGMAFEGQLIADSFDFSGGNSTTLTYEENVTTTIPKSFLVE